MSVTSTDTPLPSISLHNSVTFSLSKTHGEIGEKKIFCDGIQKIVFFSIFEETLELIPEIDEIFSMICIESNFINIVLSLLSLF